MALTLAEFMQTHPEGTLEEIAARFQVPLREVIVALPLSTLVDGDKFDSVWDELARWGQVTTLVHTPDIILEFHGDLPSGFHRHGYFNLRGKEGMSGHIKASHCGEIAFVERRFMGMPGASVIFLNQQGESMLKVFVGRDSHRQLLPEQLAAFRLLAEKLKQEEI